MPRPRTVVMTLAGVLAGLGIARSRRRDRRPVTDDRPPRSLPVGRVERTAKLAALSTRATADLAVTRARQARADDERRQELEEAFHTRTAAQAMAVMGEMKGALMKVGQMLSFVDSGLPEHYRQALASLQADAPPMDFALVQETIEIELGMPVSEAFSWIAPEPIAAASIGQVHEARLPNGRGVAVKVQYPGVDEAIRADLDNAELLQMVLGAAFPNLDPKPVVDELRERIGEELDYRIEGSNQRMFADLYAGHPFIHVPAPFPDLSSARVLTMELVGGRRWDAAVDAPDELRQRWGEAVYRFVFGSLNRHHVFNGDPHPGNYRFHDDGTVTFLDFGCVKSFSPEHMERQRAMVRSVVEGDAARLHEMLKALTLLKPDDDYDPQVYVDWFRIWYQPLLGGRDAEFTYTPEFAEEAVKANFDPLGEWGDVQRRFNMPKDIVFLNRINVGLNSILAGLRARNRWRTIAEEYWFDAPPVTELGRLDAAWRATAHPSGVLDRLGAAVGDAPLARRRSGRSRRAGA